MCRPINVGAIEPVGITNASASNVRNKNANTKAITIDSTVSRIACAVDAEGPTIVGGVDACLVVPRGWGGLLDLAMVRGHPVRIYGLAML